MLSDSTCQEGWQQEVLWGLPTSELANSEGFLSNATSGRCDLAIRKVSMVLYTRFAIGILANQDGS
jgi:hypothetical protein